MNEETNECKYYMYARKICLNVDQDSEDFSLVEDYEKYKCDFNSDEESFVHWEYFRWHLNNEEPTPKRISHTEIEVYMSKAPFVRTLTDMNVHNFDISTANYRLEAIIAFSLFGCLFCTSLCIFVFKNRVFKFEMTEEQQEKFNDLQEADEGYRNLVMRRTQLE